MTNRTHNYKVYIKADKKVYDVKQMAFENGSIAVYIPIEVSPNEEQDGVWHVVDNTSVILLQGTGKLDVKGNDIFEGMRVRGKHGIGIASWDEVYLLWILDYGEDVCDLCDEPDPSITGWSFEVE